MATIVPMPAEPLSETNSAKYQRISFKAVSSVFSLVDTCALLLCTGVDSRSLIPGCREASDDAQQPPEDERDFGIAEVVVDE